MFRSQSAAPVPDYYGQGHGYGNRHSRSGSQSRSLAQGPLPPRPSEIDEYTLDPFAAPGRDRPRASVAEPMQATAKHPKLKLKISLASGIFEAGDTINGVLELSTSTSQRLRLGEIAIELEAFEELTSRDHAATQIFLYNRTLFQSEHLPPSNAVLPAAPVKGHWTARKGRTTFPFSFKVPATCPSSIDFSGHARLRYTLKGTCQTWWNDSKTLVTVRSDAPIVERWHDELDPRYLEPIEAIADTHLFMGGTGAVWLEAALAEQLFVAGGTCRIRAGIKNNTKRNLSGIKVILARRLKLAVPETTRQPAQRLNLEPQITEVVDSVNFKGPSYEFPPQEEVVVDLNVNLPRDLRTIRKTRLFEVSAVAIVCIDMGTFAKDLMVELPLYVAHPSSLQPMDGTGTPQAPLNPPRRAVSSMGQHGQHHAVPMQPHERMAPSPSPLPNPYHHPQTPAPPVGPAMPNNAVQLPPSRPASAAGTMTIPNVPPEAFAITMQNGQPMWDPTSFNWSGPQGEPHVQPRVRSASVQYPSDLSPPHMPHALAPESLPQRANTTHQHSRQMSFPDALQPGLRAEKISSPPEMPLAQHLWSQTPSAIRRATEQNNGAITTPAGPQQALPAPTTPFEENILQMAAQQPTPQAQPTQSVFAARPASQLGTAGLTTITEDSESNAGTLRGPHHVDSVSQKNIDQFERMAEAAENEEEARKAMESMGMVPDDAGVQEKTWPKGPVSTTKKTTGSTPSKPSVAELFERRSRANSTASRQETAEEKRTAAKDAPSMHDIPHKCSTKPKKDSSASEVSDQSRTSLQPRRDTRPARSPSLQGQGLTSLESRLQPSTSDVSAASKTDKRAAAPATYATATDEEDKRIDDRFTSPDLQRRSSGHTIADSALKAAAQAAAERERRAREDEEERRRDAEYRRASEQRQKDREAEQSSRRGTVASEKKPRNSNDGERKHIDVDEMRKLNKEAVNRVAGWLTASPEASKEDLTLSPKTPSPSVLVQEKERFDSQITTSKNDTQDRKRSTSRSSEYNAQSLRGGRGGRVASVASMWASIAEGTDGSAIKSSAPVVTLRPQAQRSGHGSIRALDFSPNNSKLGPEQAPEPKSTLRPSPTPVDVSKPPKEQEFLVKSPARTSAPMSPPIVVKNRVRSPSASKSGAPHLINTTMPRPVFSNKENVADGPVAAEGAAKSKAETTTPPTALPPGLRKLADKAQRGKSSSVTSAAAATSSPQRQMTNGKLQASRKFRSDLVAAEARKDAAERAVPLVSSKLAKVASPSEDSLALESSSQDLPMGGRGTTKPIGKAKLASLRDLWGG